ncbi:MAG: MBL fold metallo-hydrolase [Kiritimatiellae bacterium]|nr:MBL fold metallo-hydrolase [Kiritimatiellia bacterium]
METRITVLVENSTRGLGLLAEHGLAFWIEIGPQRVLLDTGQSDVLFHNAKRLGITLSDADALVLSHGHYDHSGGVAQLLQNYHKTTVYVHPEALKDKYIRTADGKSRQIGMPANARITLSSYPDIQPSTKPIEVIEGLFITGPIPRLTDFEDTGGPFFLDKDCTQPDELVDDQAVFIDTPNGIVVILGCAHSGIINTLQYITSLVPERPIHAVIGGTHLVSADATRIDKTVQALRQLDIRYLFPSHCTGFQATAHLWEQFPDRVSIAPVGSVLSFGPDPQHHSRQDHDEHKR